MRFFLLSLLILCGNTYGQERQMVTANVVTKAIEFNALKISIETVGTTEAIKSVSLYPAVADVVTNVLFTPSAFVKKGDVLLTLDARRQENTLQRANIQLLDKERILTRLMKSYKDGAVTQSSVDDALTQRDLAKVSVLEAKTDLEDRKVVAPFSGYVGLTKVEPGDRIGLSSLITTIDNREKLFINFSVPESSLGLIDKDTIIQVTPWSSRERLMTATLAELDSRIDEQDRTMRVRALFNNKDDIFRPGLSFKVSISANGQSYPEIPEAALAWGATGAYVWVSRSGKAFKEPVTIKQRLRGTILVEGQLNIGDILIVEGIQRLREGQPVQSNALIVKSN